MTWRWLERCCHWYEVHYGCHYLEQTILRSFEGVTELTAPEIYARVSVLMPVHVRLARFHQALDGMERDFLLSARWGDGGPAMEGWPRRYFQLRSPESQ
jgi:hypothetical protein